VPMFKGGSLFHSGSDLKSIPTPCLVGEKKNLPLPLTTS
jgi:hypothetical protein